MVKPPRERIVLAAAQLMRTQGVNGTGLREIVERAQAPRGSLQHYFPGGKEQLVAEALLLAGDFAAHRCQVLLLRIEPRTPGELFAAFVGEWRALYLRDGFAEGCPLAAAAADSAAISEGLRAATSAALDRWQGPLEAAMRELGVAEARAPALAVLMISAFEGALILARSRADVQPLDVVVEELRPVLDTGGAG